VSGVVELIRPEIRAMRPYRSAEFHDGLVRLNANENPWPPAGQNGGPALNRYPEPRPFALGERLAAHYGVAPQQLLVTRGSSEAIDVVLRAFCRAGLDEIVICPPTFGMYEAYAQIQGACIRRVPLLRERGYAMDHAAILQDWSPASRVVFICSPNNPTGNGVPAAEIAALATALGDRGVVVLDAAYVEFARVDPTRELLARFDNVIVLRTLSKAMALAGVRCGVLLAAPGVADLLSCVLPPYTFATVCAEAVRRCLEPANAAQWRERVERLKTERDRLSTALAANRRISRVWPSEANFVLVETPEPQALVAAARAGGVLVRDFSWDRDLPGCIRITVGDPAENDQLLHALA
jgi:histidinol-phosphate aminotransferase